MDRKIDISHKTIFFITGFLVLLWVIYLALDVILLFFVAFILMSALAPLVGRLTSWKVPRPLAILLIFLLVIAVFSSLITVGFTPLINQTSNLSQKLAEAVGSFLRTNLLDQSIVNQEITNLSHQVIGFTFSFFQNLIAFASIIVLTFYLLLDREKVEDLAASIFVGKRERAKKIIGRTEEKLGAWLRGQLVLSIFVGLLSYFGLFALGVDFALPLAIIAALLEVVPIIGPIIASIPAVLIALTISPVTAALVAGLYLAIQQVESHIIVPQVMKRAVGLNPILVILAVSVGGRLLGVGGALLAVPIAVVIQVALEEALAPKQSLR